MHGSHLCTGCGCELCRTPAPPDPIYGLPICTCPSCGTSVVRRKHRIRTYPIAFKRLDRTFNRMAVALLVVVVVAGAALGVSVLASTKAGEHGMFAWPALAHAIRTANRSDWLSISLVLGIITLIQILSGLVLSRLLWHWKAKHLSLAWLGVLIGVSLLPVLFDMSYTEFDWASYKIEFKLLNRLQILGVLWLITTAGLFVGKASDSSRARSAARKHKKSLKWARKKLSRRRAG